MSQFQLSDAVFLLIKLLPERHRDSEDGHILEYGSKSIPKICKIEWKKERLNGSIFLLSLNTLDHLW